jgi:peroxiredoxin Q/BCP
MTTLAAGAKAPQFDLQTDSGKRLKLADLKGQKVVVYFYPKDDTSGCTLEAIEFTKAKAAFEKAGATVVGISPDSEESHCKFRDKHGLGITLAADPDHQAIDAYGVWVEKENYGRKYMGVQRATFLVGKDGRIAREWRDVKVAGHVEEVLAAAEGL